MPSTLLSDVVNPQVMADMISAELESKLQATKHYKVDRTLTARPGNTITVPTWKYIGMASVLAEDAEGAVTKMDTEEISYTVKKIVKNVTLTDETALSGYGDPVGQTTYQLRLALQDRMEQDGIELLKAIPNTADYLYLDVPTAALSYTTVIAAVDKLRLEEQGEQLYIMVGQSGLNQLRTDPRFIDVSALGDQVLVTGMVGTIAGCTVVKSLRIDPTTGTTTKAFVFKPEVFTAFMKRDIALETARGEDGILHKRTLFSADTHYVVAIEDYTKVVAINHKK